MYIVDPASLTNDKEIYMHGRHRHQTNNAKGHNTKGHSTKGHDNHNHGRLA